MSDNAGPRDNCSRDGFMSPIRGALRGRRTTSRIGLDVDAELESTVRTTERSAALPGVFAVAATRAGMVVHRTTASMLEAGLTGLLRGRRTVAVSIEDQTLRSVGIHSIEVSGAKVIDWRASGALDALYDADAGITDAFAALAETGTLVIRSSGATSRGGFLVPPVNIALLPASRILPDMVDLWGLLRPMPTSVVLVTGPSKTADIEGILVTGVHGPKEVHIVLIEDA